MPPAVPHAPPELRRVVVTGAGSLLGRAVCEQLRARLAANGSTGDGGDLDVRSAVVAADGSAVPGAEPIAAVLAGAHVLVHLGVPVAASPDGTGVGPAPAATRAVLDAAAAAGVSSLVLLSSAMVYGAWPNNAVPLTEDAAVRPAPRTRFAMERAEEERLAGEWARDDPSRRVALLRPAVTASERTQSWMARSPWTRVGPQAGEGAPAQFLHLDDLVSAVVLAARAGLDGVFNVAPDGWLPPDGLRALVAPAPQVRVPVAVAGRLARLRWQLGRASVPPEALPYTVHPWVVANDRLRAEGWAPTHTNEEAFVAGHRAGPLATLSPRRRQELSLVVVAVAVTGGTALAVRAARQRLGRSRRVTSTVSRSPARR